MTKQITPDTTEKIYMMICSTNVEEFLVSSEQAARYTDGILSLASAYQTDSARLSALLKKLGDSRHISLFVMPAEPWSVPAHLYAQYDKGFDGYFDEMVGDFSISHIIYGNGTKYSYRPEDDNDLAVFLQRKAA